MFKFLQAISQGGLEADLIIVSRRDGVFLYCAGRSHLMALANRNDVFNIKTVLC